MSSETRVLSPALDGTLVIAPAVRPSETAPTTVPRSATAEPRALRLTGHLPGLDGVRGLAIGMVMTLHFVGDATARTTLQRLVTKAASFGGLGVDLFFVLSGLLITGLLLDAKDRPHFFRNFYARRTLRIFPLYYFVLAMLFLVLPRLVTLPPGLAEPKDHQAWLWTYGTNFYIATQASWQALGYVTHFWSLAIEEHFYLVWPLVVYSFPRSTVERICLGVILVGLALRAALAMAGMSEISISVLTPLRIDALCVGGLLAAIARRPEGAAPLVSRSGRAVLWLGGAILVVSAWCALTQIGLPFFHQFRGSLYALLFGALTLTSVNPGGGPMAAFFQTASLRFLGKYSYGLYVYHGLLTWYLPDLKAEARLDAALGNHWLAILAYAAIGFGVSTAVAVVSYELLEKRFLLLKRYFEK
jgi:peptidoglycan/LPS O-acetylase OafA/YrhL